MYIFKSNFKGNLQMQLPITGDLIKPCNTSCSFCFLNYADLLSNNYLFNDFKPKQVGDIIKNINHKVRTFEKGEIIYHHGDEVNNLILLVKGSVIGEIMGFEGKVLRIEELKAPDSIGSSFIYGNNNTIPFDIVAKTFVKALVISKSDLLKTFMSNEKLLSNYLNILTNSAQCQTKRLKLLGLNTLKGKVAYYILECAEEIKSDIFKLDKTQNDLAELFGVARPSIGRIFKELDDENIIETKGKHISIINKTELQTHLK